MLRVKFTLLVVLYLTMEAAAAVPAVHHGDGLLFPIALGFLLKVVLVVLVALVKLKLLGVVSLGTSGVALLLALLFLKNVSWKNYPDHGWHREGQSWNERDWNLKRINQFNHGYHSYRNAKQVNPLPYLYKTSVDGDGSNGLHPVPVDAVDSRILPHHTKQQRYDRMQSETENATFQKELSQLTQTHELAN